MNALKVINAMRKRVRSMAKGATNPVQMLDELHQLGHQLLNQGRLLAAETAFKTCLGFSPDHFEIRRSLALCHLRLNQLTPALAALVLLLERKPDDLLCHLLMGRLCLRLNHPEEAKMHFQVILDAHPRNESGLSGMVDVALATGDVPGALETATHMRRLHPRSTLAHLAMANTLEAGGDVAAACQCLQDSLRHHPQDATIRYHLGRVLLKLGQLDQGWVELAQVYEAGIQPRPAVPTPRWEGQATQRLLVIGDQGLGDTLQYSRYLVEAGKRAASVTLACDASLVSFLSRALGILVIPLEQVDGFEHDAYATVTDLPKALGPLDDPYQLGALDLFAQCCASAVVPDAVRQMEGLKIGISLSCSKVHSTEQFPHTRRSCSPEDALALLQIPGAQFFHLQASPDPQAQALFGDRWHEIPGGLPDFDHTLAWVRAMDRIVCVDSSLVHVAGSIGKPTSVALPSAADWKWQLHPSTNPWYPEVRLYRQARAGEWGAVIVEISSHLKAAMPRADGS